MRLAQFLTLMLVVGAHVLLSGGPAYAGCEQEVDILHPGATCKYTRDEVQVLVSNGSTANYRYRIVLVCWSEDDGDVCANPRTCEEQPGTNRYQVYRATVGLEDWAAIGYVCLGSADEIEGREITTQDVITQFKNLTWPQAELVIQPPDGETLVNLDTIFYTTSTQPQTQTVTLLGHSVAIEASPHHYTWHWAQPGDNATQADREAKTTTGPGAPHPHQTITHRYTVADTKAHPSLDITYSGRYRVDGGAWQPIPTTATIIGTPQALTILQARPTLVH